MRGNCRSLCAVLTTEITVTPLGSKPVSTVVRLRRLKRKPEPPNTVTRLPCSSREIMPSRLPIARRGEQ
jgi:hypothetical protein